MIPYIVLIEDDNDIQKYLKDLLTDNNYSVKTAGTGISGLTLVKRSEPNLVLLDLTLPDMKGESVCTEIRKEYPNLPIIMLTAKDQVSDKLKGFTLGADDYVTKPFIADELLARIRARLKNIIDDNPVLTLGDLSLNTATFEVKRASKNIQLTPQEFKLLEFLIKNKGIVLTRDVILNRIWLYSQDIESRVVDVYMGYLRKKIDAEHKKKLLHSVRGFGYTIKE